MNSDFIFIFYSYLRHSCLFFQVRILKRLWKLKGYMIENVFICKVVRVMIKLIFLSMIIVISLTKQINNHADNKINLFIKDLIKTF